MKKQIMFIMIGLGVVAFNNLSFAEKYNKSMGIGERTIAGRVESVNESKNVFVIKDNDIPKYEVVQGWSGGIASLKAGQDAVATAKGDGILFLQSK